MQRNKGGRPIQAIKSSKHIIYRPITALHKNITTSCSSSELANVVKKKQKNTFKANLA